MMLFRLVCSAAVLLSSAACVDVPTETEEGRFRCESASDCIGGFECFSGLCCRPENMMLCTNANQDGDGGVIDASDPRDSEVLDSGGFVPDSGDGGPSLLANGAACETNMQCQSNVCVEDVCCDSSCGSNCESCLNDFTGRTTGQCQPVLLGRERNDECVGEQTCNGSGMCFFLTCPGETQLNFGEPVTATTAQAGWDFDLADWADNGNVACYAGTMEQQYRGPYQVFAIDVLPNSSWSVVLTPNPGVDVSLITWQDDPTGCAPLRGIGVRTCDVSNRNAAGGEERLDYVSFDNGFRLVILVTSPVGAVRGGFTLSIGNTP